MYSMKKPWLCSIQRKEIILAFCPLRHHYKRRHKDCSYMIKPLRIYMWHIIAKASCKVYELLAVIVNAGCFLNN